MSNADENQYKVGYKKPPLANRYEKGKSGNPSGKSKEVAETLDPGKLLQKIDNEEITVTIDGKRRRMRKGEINFRQLFTTAIKGDLTAAGLIAKNAARYFGPEAEGPSELKFIVVSDKPMSNSENETEGGAKAKKGQIKKRGSRGKAKRPAEQVSIAVQFRNVAKALITIEVDGTKRRIPRWDAYVRQIYNMALNKNNGAARLLDQLRSRFPGDLLPGNPVTYLITESDAKL